MKESMRSWWFTALVVVGGLLAQPGDAWAGKLAEKGGFREFKLGAKASPEWLKAQGCTFAFAPDTSVEATWKCQTAPIGSSAVVVTVFVAQDTLISVGVTTSKSHSRATFDEFVEIMTAAFGTPSACSQVHAYDNLGPRPYSEKKLLWETQNCEKLASSSGYKQGPTGWQGADKVSYRQIWVDGDLKLIVRQAVGLLVAGKARVHATYRSNAMESLSRRLQKKANKDKIQKAADSL